MNATSFPFGLDKAFFFFGKRGKPGDQFEVIDGDFVSDVVRTDTREKSPVSHPAVGVLTGIMPDFDKRPVDRTVNVDSH